MDLHVYNKLMLDT